MPRFILLIAALLLALPAGAQWSGGKGVGGGSASGPWSYDAGPPTSWDATGATQYTFDGNVAWTGDGNGSRMELEINAAASDPVITEDWGAFFLQDDTQSQGVPHYGFSLSCTDASDGSTNSRTCPETATSGGTQTGGSADGYCDAFGTFGDCRLKYDRAPISNLRSRLGEAKFMMSTPSLVDNLSGSFFGAKCPNAFSFYGNMGWCNTAGALFVPPPGKRYNIKAVTLTSMDTHSALTNPPPTADCTAFLAWHADRNPAVCNRPGIDTCTGWNFEPIVHLGGGATASGTPQLLDTLGEQVRITDFDGDGDSEDNDLVVEGAWEILVHHRHECGGTTTSPGQPCFSASDCTGAAPTCVIDTVKPWKCGEVISTDIAVEYSLESRNVTP